FIKTLRRNWARYCPGTNWRHRFSHRRVAASARGAEWRYGRQSSDRSDLGPVAQRPAFPKALRWQMSRKLTARLIDKQRCASCIFGFWFALQDLVYFQSNRFGPRLAGNSR